MCVMFGFVNLNVKVKVLGIMCRFAAADGKPRRLTVTEGRFKLPFSGIRQRRK